MVMTPWMDLIFLIESMLSNLMGYVVMASEVNGRFKVTRKTGLKISHWNCHGSLLHSDGIMWKMHNQHSKFIEIKMRMNKIVKTTIEVVMEKEMRQ